MKTEEIKDLRKLNIEKLREKAALIEAEVARVDMQLRTGVEKDTSQPKKLQKYLARVKTVMTEKSVELPTMSEVEKTEKKA